MNGEETEKVNKRTRSSSLKTGSMEFDSSIRSLQEAFFLSDQEIQNYISSFQKYDADKSGDIDGDEIARVFQDLGLHLDETEINDILADVDVDGSGSVGLDEYIALLSDPDGPLAETFKHQAHKSFVDPRQARLKRRFLETKWRRNLKAIRNRANFIIRSKLRASGFSANEHGRRGWAGGAGVGSVDMSSDGSLIAACDSGGRALVLKKLLSQQHIMHCLSDWQDESEADVDERVPYVFLPHAQLFHGHTVSSVKWSEAAEERMLACGCVDGRIRVWRPVEEGYVRVTIMSLESDSLSRSSYPVYALCNIGSQRVYVHGIDEGSIDEERLSHTFQVHNGDQTLNVLVYQQRMKPVEVKLELSSPTSPGSFGDSGEGDVASPPPGQKSDQQQAQQQTLVGKTYKARLYDRVVVSDDFREQYRDPSAGRVGTIVAIHLGGYECTVEWDGGASESRPQTRDTHVSEGDLELLEDFPSATKGALPTGLGEKGRVGSGRAVYALALHSVATARISVGVSRCIRETERSEAFDGFWEDLELMATNTSERNIVEARVEKIKVRAVLAAPSCVWEYCESDGRHEQEVVEVSFVKFDDEHHHLLSTSIDGQSRLWRWKWKANAIGTERDKLVSIFDKSAKQDLDEESKVSKSSGSGEEERKMSHHDMSTLRLSKRSSSRSATANSSRSFETTMQPEMPSFDALREYASLGYHIENGKLQLLSSYSAALEPSARLTEVRVGRPASMQAEAEELLLSCSDGSTLIYGMSARGPDRPLASPETFFSQWEQRHSVRSEDSTRGRGCSVFAATSSDGELLAQGSDNLLLLWQRLVLLSLILVPWLPRTDLPQRDREDGETWRRSCKLQGHWEKITRVAWRKDGKILASCDNSGCIKLWARAADAISQVFSVPAERFGDGDWCCVQSLCLPSGKAEEHEDMPHNFWENFELRRQTAQLDCSVEYFAPKHAISDSVAPADDISLLEDSKLRCSCMIFGEGECASLLLVGDDDDEVWLIDTSGIMAIGS